MEQTRRPPDAPIIAAIEPALKTGAACGGAGFLFGGASGIIRGLPPVLSGGLSALQTFTLGAGFSLCRTTVLNAWTVDGKLLPPRDKTTASAIAGAVSGGAAGLLFRGRSNALPGAIMFAIFGAAGQHFHNKWTAPKDEKPQGNFWKRMSEKSWTPFKVLTNDEYAEMLREKMLKLDVEIAVLDDRIAAMKQQQQSEVKVAPSDNSTTK